MLVHNLPQEEKANNNSSPLGQISAPQFLCSVTHDPTHSAPPFAGSGSVQALRRVCVPPSQSAVQVVQSDHWDQCPFTGGLLEDGAGAGAAGGGGGAGSDAGGLDAKEG